MVNKFWFISVDDEVVSVFDDREVAREEMFYLKEDNPTGSYRLYGLHRNELDDYSEENDLVKTEGLI